MVREVKEGAHFAHRICKKTKLGERRERSLRARKKKPFAKGITTAVAIIMVFAMVFGLVAYFGGGVNLKNSPSVTSQQDLQEQEYLARLAANPNDYSTLVSLGNLYYDRQDFTKAIAYYERALAINPNDPNVLVDTGTAYFYRQPSDPDTALLYYEKALKVVPTFPNALFNRGIVLYQGKHDLLGARAAFVRFIEVAPGHPAALKAKELIALIDKELGAPPAPGNK